jgi:hypothetical protein
MKYYLDTAAIYEIKKLPESILEQSFYSVFSLIEIIAELDHESFNRRKAALKNVLNSAAKQDNSFPEKFVFSSFDYFKDDEFIEERLDDLFDIINDVLNSENVGEFSSFELLKTRKFDFSYFNNMDKFYSKNFIDSSLKGNAMITSALKDTSEPKFVEIQDKTYNLESRRAITDFLNEPNVNSSFTILALANEAIRISGSQYSENLERQVYESYNGLLNVFVDGLSAYSVQQTINNSKPDKNDFQDMIHLYYLRNSNKLKIISNDRLFRKCVPDHFVSTVDLAIK